MHSTVVRLSSLYNSLSWIQNNITKQMSIQSEETRE